MSDEEQGTPQEIDLTDAKEIATFRVMRKMVWFSDGENTIPIHQVCLLFEIDGEKHIVTFKSRAMVDKFIFLLGLTRDGVWPVDWRGKRVEA